MTKIFLDTASMKEIEKYKSWGIIQGLTTNQKIFLKEKGCNFKQRAQEILNEIDPLPVSLEGPNDFKGILEAAADYGSWSNDEGKPFENIVIKVPMMGNGEGLKAVKALNEKFVKTNVTACMTLNQTFLAASAGATYVSLFYNRMKDWYKETYPSTNNTIGNDEVYALETIAQTQVMLKLHGFKTKLIIGSIREPEDIESILKVHPDIITIPPKILEQMPFNDKTESTLNDFEEAWKEFKKYESK